jgi:hypothetical protein
MRGIYGKCGWGFPWKTRRGQTPPITDCTIKRFDGAFIDNILSCIILKTIVSTAMLLGKCLL